MPLDCGLVARRAAGLFSFFMFWPKRRAMGVSGVEGSSLESSSRLCVFSCGGELTFVGTQRAINNLARLVYEGIQMCLTTKAFRINLVDVLGSRGPGSKPSTSRGDF